MSQTRNLLLKDLKVNNQDPSMAGIFTGISKGFTWYDQKNNPSIGVAYSYCVGGCGVIGKLYEEKNKNLDFFDRVFQDLNHMNIHDFEFATQDLNLCNQLLELFQNKKMESEMEYSYRLEKPVQDFEEKQRGDIQFVVIDENVIGQMYDGQYRNADMFTERLENSWYSTKDFLTYSNAVIAIKEDSIIGIIFGSSRYENVIDVDIEVKEEFRRQGVATILVKRFVYCCINQGLVVQWDHVESNKESEGLAKKSGFELFKKRPIYWFDI